LREPKFRTWPSFPTGRISGCFLISHAGGVAVGVHITIDRPASARARTASSSQVQSNSPWRGSILDHANSAMRTYVMPSSRWRSG
jgi:hypothetical protein